MFDKILVPTDGSKGSLEAVSHASSLAQNYGGTIHLLHVVDTSADSLLLSTKSVQKKVNELRGKGEEFIEESAKILNDDGVQTVGEIKKGKPYEAILNYSDAESVDLIVMGTHGRTGIKRYVLGSVAEKVLRGAEIPVMTVCADGNKEKQVWDYEKILVPTDGSDVMNEVVKYGTDIAQRYNAEIHSLYVVDQSFNEKSITEMLRDEGEKATKKVAQQAASRKVETKTAIAEGVPHEEIIRYTEENEIDLITMGTQGKTGLDRFFIGSVAENVVRSVEEPVLTVRATEKTKKT